MGQVASAGGTVAEPELVGPSVALLVAATAAVESALRSRPWKGRPERLELARQATITAVRSILDNELSEQSGWGLRRVQGPGPQIAQALSDQAARTFSERLGKAMTEQGYGSPPPPDVQTIVHQAKRAAMRSRDYEDARLAARADLTEFLQRLEELKDKRGSHRLVQLLQARRATLWALQVILGGAVIDLSKDHVRDVIEAIAGLLRDADFGRPPIRLEPSPISF